ALPAIPMAATSASLNCPTIKISTKLRLENIMVCSAIGTAINSKRFKNTGSKKGRESTLTRDSSLEGTDVVYVPLKQKKTPESVFLSANQCRLARHHH
ncbi:hypothetical protein BZG10_07665, partial [Salinivibrio kushneri]